MVGDEVKVMNRGWGKVEYAGNIEKSEKFANKLIYGIRLQDPKGNGNGTVEGIR